MKRLIHLVAAAASAALLVHTAAAKELTVGNYLPPSHYTNPYGLEPLAAAVKKASKGDLTLKLFPGGQLYDAQRSLSGIGGGISDAGLVVPLFARSELRSAILVTDLVFSTPNPLVSAAASTEMILLHCPECQADYKKHGALFLAGYSTVSYSLMCKPPIRTLADMRGKKTRAVGAQGQLAAAMGGVPVSIPMTEAVEAMQRGAIDCIIGPISWLTGYPGTDEVVHHILRYPFGMSGGLGFFVMNTNSWHGLSRAQKKAILDSLPGAISEVMLVGTYGDVARAEKVAKKRGITITDGGADFAKLTADFAKKNEAAAIARATRLGVKDAQKIADTYHHVVAKWEKIMAKIGNNQAAYTKALHDEIYAKIDPDKL